MSLSTNVPLSFALERDLVPGREGNAERRSERFRDSVEGKMETFWSPPCSVLTARSNEELGDALSDVLFCPFNPVHEMRSLIGHHPRSMCRKIFARSGYEREYRDQTAEMQDLCRGK